MFRYTTKYGLREQLTADVDLWTAVFNELTTELCSLMNSVSRRTQWATACRKYRDLKFELIQRNVSDYMSKFNFNGEPKKKNYITSRVFLFLSEFARVVQRKLSSVGDVKAVKTIVEEVVTM